MKSIPRFQTNFIAHWRWGVLALLLSVLFCRLGFWQLDRAEKKTTIIAAQHRFSMQAPLVWESGHTSPKHYQLVSIRGRFLSTVIFLDNRTYRGQVGYDVISPLLLHDGKVVLVDRGFVPAGRDRTDLPTIHCPPGVLDVAGVAYYPSRKQWALGNILDSNKDNKVVIELLDVRILSQFLHKSIVPFIIRLRPASPFGFIRDWPVVSMPPTRHIAYAIQWFAMALVIVILFVGLNVKKKIE